jgi:hypothetical protein
MVRTGVTRYGWWIAARLGLCLAGIDDVEVNRVRFRRLRVAMPLVAMALLLTVLGAGLTVKPSAEVQAASSGLPTKLQNWCYIAALAASALAIWILLYVRATVARAVADRDLDPLARRATLRNLIRSREGGLPVRVRWDDGLWMWLTGSKEILAPIERHVVTRSHKGIYRLTVALVYHPRSHVIKEIAGLKVEVLEPVWSSNEIPAPIPLCYGDQPWAYRILRVGEVSSGDLPV